MNTVEHHRWLRWQLLGLGVLAGGQVVSGVWAWQVGAGLAGLAGWVLAAASLLGLVWLGLRLGREVLGPIRSLLESLTGNARSVGNVSQQVASIAAHLSELSQQLASASEQQAASIEETSTAVEQTHEMVRTTAGNATAAREMASRNSASAGEAHKLADTARQSSQAGQDAMNRVSQVIGTIKASSAEMASIIQSIDAIAFQTSLLALNAAVEAARAGDAGKGFAVVAEEVRNLAMKSAQAASDTTALIEQSQKQVDQGVAESQKMAGVLDRIGQEIEQVASHINDVAADSQAQTGKIEEISEATEDQARNTEQINTAVVRIDKVTQANAASAEEMAASAEELASQAEELKGLVASLETIARQDDPASPAADGYAIEAEGVSPPASARASGPSPKRKRNWKHAKVPSC
jgi:methyl-accepting chemotaxis protein